MTDEQIKYMSFVKYKCGYPSAVAHKKNDGSYKIIPIFTVPDIVIGRGLTEGGAWEDAYKKLVDA